MQVTIRQSNHVINVYYFLGSIAVGFLISNLFLASNFTKCYTSYTGGMIYNPSFVVGCEHDTYDTEIPKKI